MRARFSAFSVATTGPMPMISGAQPPTATERMRASGFSPCALAKSSEVTSTAEAPSVKGEEVPAVTVPLQGAASVATVNKLIEALEDHDDVKEVYSNAEFPDE